MRTMNAALAATVAALFLTAGASAGSLAEQFAACASKFANTKTSASVMLECNAADGKLSDCKVLEAPSPAAGFDKAAMCVAEALPVGSRTGSIKVPVKFTPNS